MQIRSHVQNSPSDLFSWQGPWLWITGGAAGSCCSLAWLLIAGDWQDSARGLLLFLSLLSTGIGIVLRPGSAAGLGAAAGVGALSWLSMGPAEWPAALWHWIAGKEIILWLKFQAPSPNPSIPWDTARLILFFLTLVAAVAAVLMLLPRVVRRGAVSFMILFHFAGILSAVFSVPPAPWWATNLWAYVFRPYLDFMYLNNAYHFYSPDPGPPNLLWFRLEYEDGSLRWYKMPNPKDYPSLVNYQRRLSLTESTHPTYMIDPARMAQRQHQRARIEEKYPAHPMVSLAAQFREPNAYAKRMIENYVRHVAQNDPYAGEGRKVVKVRLYRVMHDIIEARQLVDGVHPLDRWLYRPYYQGEYDPEGKLLNPNDPMLYWLVPIVRKDQRIGWAPPHPEESLVMVQTPERTYEVYDFLKVHAGDYQ